MEIPHYSLHSSKAKMKLRATLVTLLLCLASTAWSDDNFEESGATGRGPRIVEQKVESGCKQETNWQVCSDDDWGTKCPSGCRVQGLSDKIDKEFSNRIDAIKKKLKDGETSYETIDIRTKETYKQIKDNLVAAQQSDGSYNQVSENLRQKIDILIVKVSRQIERIKLLQKSIRDQVVEMKRLEVDIDIKLRACKGSCAKGVDFHVDTESYENIQKQLLQAESTDLRPNANPLPVLKMRPLKESPVDSNYKALTLEKEKYPIFSDIGQHLFVLEGKPKEVSKCPNGCRVQGLITKIEKEIFSRMDTAKQSWVTSNSDKIKILSELKQIHEVADRKVLTEKETVKYFAKLGNKLRSQLTNVKIMVNEQITKLKHLHKEIEDQLVVMKILEVDIDIKIRTCKGSCQNVHDFTTNLENYKSLKKDLDTITNYQIDDSKTLRNIGFINLHVQKNAACFMDLWPLMEIKQLEMFDSVDQYMLKLEDI